MRPAAALVKMLRMMKSVITRSTGDLCSREVVTVNAIVRARRVNLEGWGGCGAVLMGRQLCSSSRVGLLWVRCRRRLIFGSVRSKIRRIG